MNGVSSDALKFEHEVSEFRCLSDVFEDSCECRGLDLVKAEVYLEPS